MQIKSIGCLKDGIPLHNIQMMLSCKFNKVLIVTTTYIRRLFFEQFYGETCFVKTYSIIGTVNFSIVIFADTLIINSSFTYNYNMMRNLLYENTLCYIVIKYY